MPAGKRRLGQPRTEAERKLKHKELTGGTKLPPRGTGLKKGGKYGEARREMVIQLTVVGDSGSSSWETPPRGNQN